MVRDRVEQERQIQGTYRRRCARWAQHSTRGGRRSRRRELSRLLLACQCQRKELRLFVSPQESLREVERTKAFRISCQLPAGCIYLTWRGWHGAQFTVGLTKSKERFTSASLLLLLGPGHPQVPGRDAQVPFARTRPKRRGGDRWWCTGWLAELKEALGGSLPRGLLFLRQKKAARVYVPQRGSESDWSGLG